MGAPPGGALDPLRIGFRSLREFPSGFRSPLVSNASSLYVVELMRWPLRSLWCRPLVTAILRSPALLCIVPFARDVSCIDQSSPMFSNPQDLYLWA